MAYLGCTQISFTSIYCCHIFSRFERLSPLLKKFQVLLGLFLFEIGNMFYFCGDFEITSGWALWLDFSQIWYQNIERNWGDRPYLLRQFHFSLSFECVFYIDFWSRCHGWSCFLIAHPAESALHSWVRQNVFECHFSLVLSLLRFLCLVKSDNINFSIYISPCDFFIEADIDCLISFTNAWILVLDVVVARLFFGIY